MQIEKWDLSDMETSVTQTSSSLFYEKWLGTEVYTYSVRCGNYVIWPQIEILKIQANNQELLMNDGNIYRCCEVMQFYQDQILLQTSCQNSSL